MGLNATYSPLLNVSLEAKTACTILPNVSTWEDDPAVDGTMFLALTDLDLYLTPYNLTQISPTLPHWRFIKWVSAIGGLGISRGLPSKQLIGSLVMRELMNTCV